MRASVNWLQEMSFTGTADTGYTVNIDTGPASGGHDSGFRPMELVLVGVAGCTALDVISILQKQRQEVTSFQVQMEADRATDHPRVFTTIHVHYVVNGRNIDTTALERAIELSKDKYCSASAMVAKTAEMTYTYEIISES